MKPVGYKWSIKYGRYNACEERGKEEKKNISSQLTRNKLKKKQKKKDRNRKRNKNGSSNIGEYINKGRRNINSNKDKITERNTKQTYSQNLR